MIWCTDASTQFLVSRRCCCRVLRPPISPTTLLAFRVYQTRFVWIEDLACVNREAVAPLPPLNKLEPPLHELECSYHTMTEALLYSACVNESWQTHSSRWGLRDHSRIGSWHVYWCFSVINVSCAANKSRHIQIYKHTYILSINVEIQVSGTDLGPSRAFTIGRNESRSKATWDKQEMSRPSVTTRCEERESGKWDKASWLVQGSTQVMTTWDNNKS